jgi:DNA mismatch repair protein MutL
VGRIHRLAPDLANQIAAGEVVERPASVVKELVENAIDAGARRISIAVELGGKKLIRVEDDGEGMDPDDARLAIERHATSKIAHADDLGAIDTLGFRGEALPSIASVSHFTLRTRPSTRSAAQLGAGAVPPSTALPSTELRAGGTQSGTEIKVNGGTIASVREVGAPEGTCIEVADLFYNLPARRKFLKSDTAETTQISRLATQLALGYPEVGFTVTSSGRSLLQCTPVNSLRERFFQLFGERADLVEVRKEAGGLQIEGYVAALGDQGPTRGAQNVFVNRRIVKDRTIAHAIIEAYSVATIKERSPEVHLFLRIAPDRVDVNVHPTKAEVRFLEGSLVHEVLRRALGEALGQGRAPELQFRLEQDASLGPGLPTTMSIPGILAGATVGNRWAPADPVARFSESAFPIPDPRSPIPDPRSPIPDIRPMIPLGQFRDTFIIAVDDEGVAIIDQHVAHERVLFEQVMERLTAGRMESQRLLTPILLELTPAQRDVLRQHAATLERFGMELEEFGGDSVRLSALPALLDPSECEAAVRALAEDLEGLAGGGGVPEVDIALRKIAATMACHAAVKANYPLTLDKMRYILEELRRTAYSSVCPHGRPVVLRLTRREIEKNFQRI